MSAPGEALRHLRKQAGVRQMEMSRGLGMSPSYLSRVESGKANASFPWMLRALEYLGQQTPSFESAVELEQIAAQILSGKYEVPEVKTLAERVADLESRVDDYVYGPDKPAEPATCKHGFFVAYDRERHVAANLYRLAKDARERGDIGKPDGPEAWEWLEAQAAEIEESIS